MKRLKQVLVEKAALILRSLFATAILVSTVLYFVNRGTGVEYVRMVDLVGEYEHAFIAESDSVFVTLEFRPSGEYVTAFHVGGVRFWSVSGVWGRLVTGEIALIDSACFDQGKLLIGRYAVTVAEGGIVLNPLLPIFCVNRENKLSGYWKRSYK